MWIEFGDHGVNHRDWVAVVDVGAPVTSRLPVAVKHFHPLGFSAPSTLCSSVFARAAIPVLVSSGEAA
jgi:hypothetical protein